MRKRIQTGCVSLLLPMMIGLSLLGTTCDGPARTGGCVGMNSAVVAEIASGVAAGACPAMNSWAKEEDRACGGLFAGSSGSR